MRARSSCVLRLLIVARVYANRAITLKPETLFGYSSVWTPGVPAERARSSGRNPLDWRVRFRRASDEKTVLLTAGARPVYARL